MQFSTIYRLKNNEIEWLYRCAKHLACTVLICMIVHVHAQSQFCIVDSHISTIMGLEKPLTSSTDDNWDQTPVSSDVLDMTSHARASRTLCTVGTTLVWGILQMVVEWKELVYIKHTSPKNVVACRHSMDYSPLNWTFPSTHMQITEYSMV